MRPAILLVDRHSWDCLISFFLLWCLSSDPSGNYGGWKATAIGNNHQVLVLPYVRCVIFLWLFLSLFSPFTYFTVFPKKTAKDKLKTDYDEGMDIGKALTLAASVSATNPCICYLRVSQ